MNKDQLNPIQKQIVDKGRYQGTHTLAEWESLFAPLQRYVDSFHFELWYNIQVTMIIMLVLSIIPLSSLIELTDVYSTLEGWLYTAMIYVGCLLIVWFAIRQQRKVNAKARYIRYPLLRSNVFSLPRELKKYFTLKTKLSQRIDLGLLEEESLVSQKNEIYQPVVILGKMKISEKLLFSYKLSGDYRRAGWRKPKSKYKYTLTVKIQVEKELVNDSMLRKYPVLIEESSEYYSIKWNYKSKRKIRSSLYWKNIQGIELTYAINQLVDLCSRVGILEYVQELELSKKQQKKRQFKDADYEGFEEESTLLMMHELAEDGFLDS
ncbi:hypothetical protein [Algivirga pacifica]|uniref:Uncharacterized protein n=1 Tax=Algivirga pacifica TaxID=1162670 RepID=A0ABP9DD70_9BACT